MNFRSVGSKPQEKLIFRLCNTVLVRIYVLFHLSFSRKINETLTEVKASEYFKRSYEVIIASKNSPLSILCLGIGNFSDCHIARHQLAYILALKQALRITTAIFHEPVLTTSEIKALQSLGCHVHSINLEGKCLLSEPTLAYLPHCPKQLTNNFLWRNWSSEYLRSLILISNSFAQTIDNTLQRFLDTDAAYITRLHQFTKEQHLRNNYRYTDIFNDTSVHTFESTAEAPADFWLPNEEPCYVESTELITTQLIAGLLID